MTAQILPFPPIAHIRDLHHLGYGLRAIARITGHPVHYVRQVLTEPDRPARWVSAS